LRNGAPFKDWDLPAALTQVRAKLTMHAEGDRQFVKILGAVLDRALVAVEALEAGIASSDVILTAPARRRLTTLCAPLPASLQSRPGWRVRRPFVAARLDAVAVELWRENPHP
jgi:hypothetical protein